MNIVAKLDRVLRHERQTVVPAADRRRRRYPRSLRRRSRRATSHAYREAGMSEVAQPNEHGTRIQQTRCTSPSPRSLPKLGINVDRKFEERGVPTPIRASS